MRTVFNKLESLGFPFFLKEYRTNELKSTPVSKFLIPTSLDLPTQQQQLDFLLNVRLEARDLQRIRTDGGLDYVRLQRSLVLTIHVAHGYRDFTHPDSHNTIEVGIAPVKDLTIIYSTNN